jgi:DNA-binding winged helix-turn-helix (wHTH) protein
MKDGQRVSLSRLPSRLLLCLIENAGRIMTYEDIIQALWNRRVQEATLSDKRNVQQYITAMRRALNDPPANSRFIVSEPGVGYWFREEVLAGTPAPFPAPVAITAAKFLAEDRLRKDRQREIATLLNHAFTIGIQVDSLYEV